MRDRTALYVLAGIGLAAAGGIGYLATRSAGPVKLQQFVELRQGPLQEHLVTAEELQVSPVFTGHHYPARVAPMVTACIHQGFAPHYQVPDPQAAALPAEVMW